METYSAMLNDPDKESETESIEIRCYFVRERNALLVRGEFSPIYTDFYLHLMQHQIRYQEAQDQQLKDALATLTLHLASRPWNEATAWTLNTRNPRQNLFVTGSNRQGNITGRIFTEDVRDTEKDLFYSQVTADGQSARQSVVEIEEENDIFEIAESYYKQSEQRTGRFFRHDVEDFVFVTAQPDCDMPWLLSLTDEKIRTIDQEETLSLLETRHYRFDCGCSPGRLFPIVAGMSDSTIDEVFAGKEVIAAGCPRCGAKYTLTREALEAFQSQENS